MAKPFRGVVNLEIRDSVPDCGPYEQPKAPPGSPNVLYIVLDDVGLGAMSCYGGPIDTPNIDRIAANELRCGPWHTTALCSPTRSCLLTGRNHHQRHGISGCAVGFRNAPHSVRSWSPVARGFERFHGFLGAETSQWYPDLVHDNHPVEQPTMPEDGYHFSTDITDKALEFIGDVKAIAPDRPVFLYYAPGRAHAPRQVPREWIERYRGRFDAGDEALREQTMARRKETGLLPQNTELPPLNPIGTP